MYVRPQHARCCSLNIALLLIFVALILSACDWLDTNPPVPSPTPVPPAQQSPAATTLGVNSPNVGGRGLATPMPTQPGVRPCLATDLQAVAGWEGATGSMAGGVSFVNKSSTSCVLPGRPGIHLVDAEGNLLPVANLPFSKTPSASGAASAGAVVLRPGTRAFVFFVWSNWCGQAPGPYKVAVALPGEGGQITITARDPEGKPLDATPRCDSPDMTSTVSVGPFEPTR